MGTILKKKLVLFICIILVIISFFLCYDYFLSAKKIIRLSFADRLLIWLITGGIFVYYNKLNGSSQLVTASVATDKNNDDRLKNKNKSNLTFKDVAGLEEIKEELQEIIDFMNNSEKYKRMGAKIPKGVLFHGPPGTGKTLLAKALAGEANSSFLYSSGSEFVEKYVGVGAKRIRALYEKAKKDTPCIIFIDELDAIGSKRNLDSNNEKDQTLNQLLVEMDGFNENSAIVVIGATNRLDLLDEALLRPGRFDRHIHIGNPNLRTRQEILKVHMKNKPVDDSVNIDTLSKKTHGFSGAQLANIANEAAILAVRNNRIKIDINDFNDAIERVVAGLKVKHPTVLLKEKETVAFHEAGHAVVSKLLDTDLIQKISIIPRGQALGYVLKFPDGDRYLLTKSELLSKIKVLLGGRVAELICFNEISTGAKDDLKKSTDIAENMVCNYGMSSFGNISIKDYYIKYNYKEIELEISKIIENCFNETLNLIKQNKQLLNIIAKYLLEHETMTKDELDEIWKQNYIESETAI